MSCPDCFKGAEHSHGPEPTGTEATVAGYKCYVASPPSSSSTSPPTATIIYLCDAFGPDFVNNRQLADKYAARTGFRVLVPYVMRDPPSPTMMEHMHFLTGGGIKLWDIVGQVKRIMAAVSVMSALVPFMVKNRPAVAKPKVLGFVRAVKAESPGQKIGVAGFCWGGRWSTNLCAEPAVEGGKEPLVNAGFAAHPSGNSDGEFIAAVTKFKVPYSMSIGDKDMVMSAAKVEAMQAAVRQAAGPGNGENGYYYEITMKKNCTHGFAVRGVPGNIDEEKGSVEAEDQAVEWFKKWLS